MNENKIKVAQDQHWQLTARNYPLPAQPRPLVRLETLQVGRALPVKQFPACLGKLVRPPAG